MSTQNTARQPLDLQLAKRRRPIAPVAHAGLLAADRLGGGSDAAEVLDHLIFRHAPTIAPAIAHGNSGAYLHSRDDSHMPTIGKRIEALRIAKGLSQTALAKRVGISQPSLSNIEKDKTETLRGETLAGLCAALDVSPEVILRGRGKDPEAILFERELVAAWRDLTPEDQQHLLAVARALRERMRTVRLLPSPKARDSVPAITHTAARED